MERWKIFPLIEYTSMILEDLASVKDEYELDCIRAAVEVTDTVYEEILPMLRLLYRKAGCKYFSVKIS